MRDLRVLRNKRSNRKKGRSMSFFSIGLIFLFFSAVAWGFMVWKEIGEKKSVETITPGRMIHSGLQKPVSISLDEKRAMADSQDPIIVKNMSLPTVKISERRGEKSALNPEALHISDADPEVFTSPIVQDSSDTEEWVINSLNPSNPKTPSGRKGVVLTPLQGEPLKIYTIQVAAFREKVRADVLIDELKDKGYSAYLQIGDIKKGENWYRVRVGAFKHKEEAKREAENLRKQGGFPIYVTRMTN